MDALQDYLLGRMSWKEAETVACVFGCIVFISFVLLCWVLMSLPEYFSRERKFRAQDENVRFQEEMEKISIINKIMESKDF